MITITKWIKREDAIGAVKTEPLMPGSFFENDNDPKCRVCAVGAVMRKVSFEKSIKDIYFKRGTAYDLGFIARDQVCIGRSTGDRKNKMHALKYKHYLSALSIHFEDKCKMLCFTLEGKKIRASCVSFIKRHFPKRFKVTVKV